MKICIDVDGVLCELRKPDETYETLLPKAGAVEKMQSLKNAGHYLILSTARHMGTCNSNIGLVVARQGKPFWIGWNATRFPMTRSGSANRTRMCTSMTMPIVSMVGMRFPMTAPVCRSVARSKCEKLVSRHHFSG